jgi:hypothetical protein
VSYQHSTPFLASAAFVSDMHAFARELHASAPRDEADSAFLQDVARGRYPMVALQRLMAIAARSEKLEHREFLAEVVRRECGAAVAGHCIAAAFDWETEANGEANNAQRKFERAPCRSTAEMVRAALMRQLSTTRTALDAVLSHRVWQ